MEVRLGRLVNEQPPDLCTQQKDRLVIDDDDMESNTATKSDLSLKSRSFLHRKNDRVRKTLDRSPENAMQDVDKRSMIWGMVMSSTLKASVFRKHRRSHNETDVRHIKRDLWGEHN